MRSSLFKLQSSSSQRLLAILLLVPTMPSATAGSYIINPDNTNVRFAIERFKTSATTGGFYKVKGQLKYDTDQKTGDISLTIPISSLSTGNTVFNNNLKGPDFFDMQRFPTARFESTKWYFNNSTSNSQVSKVEGNLTLHGETHPITLTATKFSCYQSNIMKKEICAGNFSTTIDRTRWNINKYALFGLTKNLNLKVQVEAIKQ